LNIWLTARVFALSSAPAFVTRFAPSPTGRLHLGHAFSALCAYEAARNLGGHFILRIEDIDQARCRPEFEAAIYEDLAWLGLRWEEPVRRQSDHRADYEAALDQLKAQGLLYRCFRSRKEIYEIAGAPHGPVEAFRGAPLPADEEAARLQARAPYAWRLSLDRAKALLGADWDALTFTDMDAGVTQAAPQSARMLWARPDAAGDVVLARKEVGVAYHLASVVDDALQGVTHVIRGEDLRDAVHIHRLLQSLLGLPTPVYRHHRLLLDAEGRRLAKRAGSKSLRDLRLEGADPARLRVELGFPA
jgi:glutamyl-Q tRNA(Asp) synthetase